MNPHAATPQPTTGDSPEQITVRRLKWPDLPHRTNTHPVVNVDEHGLWARVPPNTDTSPEPGWEFAAHHEAVLLIPTNNWWTAYWSTHGSIYIDITTPATWAAPSAVSVIDLALDVYYPDGTNPVVLDRDEFERESTLWPAELRERALKALDELLARFTDDAVRQAGWSRLR